MDKDQRAVQYLDLSAALPEEMNVERDGNTSLTDHPVVMWATQLCGACPESYEGQLITGEYFYFRYRGGRAALGIGSSEHEASTATRTWMTHGDPLQGVFDSAEERDAVFSELLHLRSV